MAVSGERFWKWRKKLASGYENVKENRGLWILGNLNRHQRGGKKDIKNLLRFKKVMYI